MDPVISRRKAEAGIVRLGVLVIVALCAFSLGYAAAEHAAFVASHAAEAR